MSKQRYLASLGVFTLVVGLTYCPCALGREEKEVKRGDAKTGTPKILLSAPVDLMKPPFAGSVKSIDADGSLQIGPFQGKASAQPVPENKPLSEGFYLGVVRGTLKALDDAHLVRVEVTEVRNDGTVTARVARGLDKKLATGKLILLVRPPQSTTAQMKSLPDLVTISKGPVPASLPPESAKDSGQARVERSFQNLRDLARAMLMFNDTYGQFPPAMLVGPDGKAWHSWRVLLLPYLDQIALYQRYRFDEPWDGPNNQELLKLMPRVYSDEPTPKAADTFTRYAAVTGPGMTFSADGFRFDGKKFHLGKGAGIKMAKVADGTANTLAIGTLPRGSKIPWTKPKDVVVEEKSMRLGENGGFGSPYKSGKAKYGLFARIDGGVMGVFESIDADDFHALLTIADRKPSDLQKVVGVFAPEVTTPAQLPAVQQGVTRTEAPVVFYVFEEEGEWKARLAR